MSEETQKETKAESQDSSVAKDDIILGDKSKDINEKEVASVEEMKAAYQNLKTDKASDTSDEEPAKEEKTEVKPDEDSLDSLLEEVVKENETELAKKRESLADKTDRPEYNKIKELERKVEELSALAKPTVPKIQPMSEEWFQTKADELGVDVDSFKISCKALDVGFKENFVPYIESLTHKINDLEGKLTKKDIAEVNSKDKLFKLIKPDYDSIIENDETVKSLPPEHRHKVALALAKEKNIEKVLDIVRKAKGSPKKLVVNDGGSVSAPPPQKKSGLQLTKDDIRVARELGYSEKDIANIGKVQRTFIEE